MISKTTRFEVLDAVVNLETRQLTHEALLGVMARHPDLVGVYCAGGGMEGAIAALREAGADPDPGAGGEVSFLRARMANEVLKAQTAKVKLARMKGELVDRARTTTMVFDLARRERDAWQNWPARVAANMAADLGVDAHRMEQVLDTYLRQHLADLAEVKIDLR